MNRRLPVTLVGGFLGAGKTSLLHHIISEYQGGHLAVLVENPGALNLDAKALRGLCGAMRRTNDAVFEIPDGNEAMQVQAIANTLRDLSLAGRYERVLIEVAGTASATWLAEYFLAGGACHEWAELQQIICVVDALDYYRANRGPESEAPFQAFQNEQIAGATLIVLNKCDTLDERELESCRRILRQQHPRVRIIETAYGEVPSEIWAKPATPEELEMAIERKSRTESEQPKTSGDENSFQRKDLVQTVQATLLEAARASFGPARDLKVELDSNTGKIKASARQIVVEVVRHPHDEISLPNARLIKADAVLGETIEANINTRDFGRIAARIFKETMNRELRDIEKDLLRSQLNDAEMERSLPPLSSALYRVHRPFHPARFWDWFNADHPGLLRVKGLIWLATRNLLVGGVSRTRWENSCGAAGIWWAALPREEWPEEPEALMRMQETWREPYGDRRQELVLIGEMLPLSGPLRRELDACLLTDAEMAQPVKEWAGFPDPFPVWDLEDEG